MSEQETPRLGLPLIQPAQAQKHVTVNEALIRLDALANLVIEAIGAVMPPVTAPEGACWVVGAPASGEWQGQGGTIAIRANGGWVHVVPPAGLRGMMRTGAPVVFDGEDWQIGALSVTPSGAGIGAQSLEASVVPAAGGRAASGLYMPAGVLIIGVTARVTAALSGDLASWSLGTGDAVDRFGSGLGIGAGSWCRGILSQPMVYWSPESLDLIAEGGDFGGEGAVTVAIHWLELALPR